jgi:hypothetical protein
MTGRKTGLYDFHSGLQFLLQDVDINDPALVARRAVELHTFQFSLYCPYLTQLPISEKVPKPKTCMIVLGRKYAALRLFHYYASRALKNTTGIKHVVDLHKLQAGLASNLEQIEVLLQLVKDYLAAGRDDSNVPKRYMGKYKFINEFRNLLEKSRGSQSYSKDMRPMGTNFPIVLDGRRG